ncbi:MAG: glycoside hydrolase family 130 protein [Actinomycetota bacterium]
MEVQKVHPPLATRLSHKPVVEARTVPGYDPIFNAGLLVYDDTYHLFARGVRDGYRLNPGDGPRFLDYISDVLVFESTDGIDYSFRYVLAESGHHGTHSFEDPRVQRVRSDGNVQIVMTYTNLPPVGGHEPWRIGVHRLVYDDGRFHLDGSSGRVIGPEGIGNKDAVIFNLADGGVALMHRIHPNMQVAVFDSLDAMWDADTTYWDDHLANLETHTILAPSPGASSVGAGAPPIPTSAGLLLFFHERRDDGSYTVNVALLDPATARVLARLPEPLLWPELPWERAGDVQNVVFVQGAHRREDGTIYLTYGAADRCVGAATVPEAQLLEALEAAR